MVYAQAIRDFGLFAKKPYEEVTKDDVKAFLDQASKKYSPGGIRNYVRRLKPFYKWLLGDGDRYPDCMKWVNGNITRTKGERVLASVREKIVNEEEYRTLITAIKNSRDKALVSSIWDTGARASEVPEMRLSDVIDLHSDRPAVIVGGGKRRIPLIHDSVAYLISWLNVHPAPSDANAPLWPARVDRSSDDSGMLGYKGLQTLLQRACRKGGLRPITAHMFRHTRASFHAKNGVSPYAMNNAMGWSAGSRMWQTYHHLQGSDTDASLRSAYGQEVAELKKEEVKVCPRCKTPRPVEGKYCLRCGMALSLDVVMLREQERRNRDDLMSQLLQDADIQQLMGRKIRELGLIEKIAKSP